MVLDSLVQPGQGIGYMGRIGCSVRAVWVSESPSRLMCLYRWKLLVLVVLISIIRLAAVFSSFNAQNVHEERNFRMQNHYIPLSRFLCSSGAVGKRQYPLR
jgi:hypothetical protein